MTSIDWTVPNWAEIRDQLREIIVTHERYRVASPADLEDHVISKLTYGQLKSPFMHKLETLQWIYSVDKERREMLEALGYELGFYAEPPDVSPYARTEPINWRLIHESIERQEMSPEFILAWGRLNYLFGRYDELVFNSDRAEKEIEHAIAGKLNSTLVQECWFAHWINANSRSFIAKDRARAESDIARVCWRIHEGELRPAEPYPAAWFCSMLEEAKREKRKIVLEALKTTYTRLKVSKIRELIQHPKITPAVLPPLRATEFRLRRSTLQR